MNSWYQNGLKHFSQADVNYPSDNIKACLVSALYTPNLTTDEFLSTVVASGGILKRSANLSGKTNTGGVLNCSNILFSLVTTGFVGKYVVFYKDTGVDATSILLLIDDTGNNFPVTTDGGDITFQVSTGANKLGHL